MCHSHGHCCSPCSASTVGAKSCSCSCHQRCGSHGSCSHSMCQSNHGEPCDYVSKFLELADQAWMEVLKEKIKEHIRANPRNMDELAKIIAEANHDRWRNKMESKHCVHGYEDRIRHFFGESCQAIPK